MQMLNFILEQSDYLEKEGLPVGVSGLSSACQYTMMEPSDSYICRDRVVRVSFVSAAEGRLQTQPHLDAFLRGHHQQIPGRKNAKRRL